jgi:hypothetical protein
MISVGKRTQVPLFRYFKLISNDFRPIKEQVSSIHAKTSEIRKITDYQSAQTTLYQKLAKKKQA